ncbi:MAG: MBL fold metallo-hydrolase [Candidatus Omnitrophica bacterium]|nr:MBL fold metallo-hydrolase [Candidatus Omnitrophota bacterium]
MEAKILFNSEAISEKLSIGWGFSCLVNKCVLFDTGEKDEYLFNNIANMEIDISRIKTVVISHDHWDHIGGLWKLLEQQKGIKVYSCPNFNSEFKKKVEQSQGILIESDKFVEIEKNIFVTGEIKGTYKGEYMPEQALVIKTKKGISIITGCSHPGIIKMLKKINNEFPQELIYSVFGGFHLMDEDNRYIENIAEQFREMKIKKAGPTHCSGKEAEGIFKEKYGNNFITLKSGQILDI